RPGRTAPPPGRAASPRTPRRPGGAVTRGHRTESAPRREPAAQPATATTSASSGTSAFGQEHGERQQDESRQQEPPLPLMIRRHAIGAVLARGPPGVLEVVVAQLEGTAVGLLPQVQLAAGAAGDLAERPLPPAGGARPSPVTPPAPAPRGPRPAGGR